MKKMLLLGTLGLLIFCSSAPAVSCPVAPADTVAGHARMVKKIHAAMCTSVSNDRTTAFDKMTPPDTAAGEARLTRRLTQGICEQVALESRHQDLAVLTRK